MRGRSVHKGEISCLMGGSGSLQTRRSEEMQEKNKLSHRGKDFHAGKQQK